MSQLDSFNTIPRSPISKTYVAPSGPMPPHNAYPQESFQVPRFRERPQLKGIVHDVLVNGTQTPSDIAIISKARSDQILLDTFNESESLSKLKAEFNIFSPSGWYYNKANAENVIAQPPRPAQQIQTYNANSGVNNLSNAGTNYYGPI